MRPPHKAGRGEYRQYVTEEQRREVGCSAGRMQRGFHHGLPGAVTTRTAQRVGSVSARRSLMNAWRVTPNLRASRSISRRKSTGKSTLTRCVSRPGRRALPRSTYGVRSAPASCSASSRAALTVRRLEREVALLLFRPRPPDRDDADSFIAIREKCRPQRRPDPTDDLPARLVNAPCYQFEPIWISPYCLSVDEVYTVLDPVR